MTYDGQDHNLAWDNDTSGFVLDDYMDTYDCPAYRCAGTYTGTQVIDNAKFASGTRGDVTGNYNITYEGELVITQATITVERNGVDKIYDGTLHADYTWNMIGKIAGDDVQYHEESAFFHDKNIGGNKPILINGDSLSGSDLSNYTVVFTGADADITPCSLTIIIDDAAKQEGEPDPEFIWGRQPGGR